MDIADFLPYYPSVDDPSLQAVIYNKKEFFENKLEVIEAPTIIDGQQRLKQQVIIERFFCGYTPYDEGLIYHAMGTGKTCAAFSVSESLKKRGSFKRCIVMAAGSDSLDNLRRELITRCSADYQVEEKGLSPEELMRKSRRLVKKFYRFETYYSFAKDCSQISDENLVKFYSKTIFIVDEAHNVLTQQEEKEGRVLVYENLFRAFHVIKQRKILLLTGTPMRNDVQEFSLLMNLILPLDKQLVDFVNTFFVERSDDTLQPNPRKESLLKEILRGRISYLSDPKFDFEIKWQGNPQDGYADIPQFRSLDVKMSSFQTEAYMSAFRSDTTGKGGEFYLNSIQASLFVFPDGSWGEEGREKFFKDDAFIDSLKQDDMLKKYSTKYYYAVKTIEMNRDKNVFIYCSSIQGSGLETLAMILKRRGFANFKTNDSQTFGKRFMMLTSKTKNIGSLVKEFNRARNKNGSYCQVILGSRKIAEGYSFKNIQIEMLLTQHWNEAETAQASRRGARFGSWNAFKGPDGRIPRRMFLSIAKICAIPDSADVPSIDKFMLQTSLVKDFSIKRLDKVIKEVSFDCPLTFERNYNSEAKDGSRECDYGKCTYVCDAEAAGFEVKGGEDLTTYELYYEQYMDLVPRIISIFGKRDSFLLTTLFDIIRPQTTLQLIKALVYIIENNISIINRSGIPSFLREYSNTYYLTSDISAPNDSMEFCFLSNPIFSKRTTLNDTLENLKTERTISTLEKIGDAKSEEDVLFVLEQFDDDVINVIAKLSIRESLFGKENFFCRTVLQKFKNKIFFEKENEYLAVYKDTNDVVWCLKENGTWTVCVAKRKSKEKEETGEKEEEVAAEFKARIKKVGFEGIIEGDKFCIRKVLPGEVGDKRKATTGSVCQQGGWKKHQLKEIIDKLKIKGITEKDKKDVMCAAIERWFKKNGVVRRGKCGTARKKKEV